MHWSSGSRAGGWPTMQVSTLARSSAFTSNPISSPPPERQASTCGGSILIRPLPTVVHYPNRAKNGSIQLIGFGAYRYKFDSHGAHLSLFLLRSYSYDAIRYTRIARPNSPFSTIKSVEHHLVFTKILPIHTLPGNRTSMCCRHYLAIDRLIQRAGKVV